MGEGRIRPRTYFERGGKAKELDDRRETVGQLIEPFKVGFSRLLGDGQYR